MFLLIIIILIIVIVVIRRKIRKRDEAILAERERKRQEEERAVVQKELAAAALERQEIEELLANCDDGMKLYNKSQETSDIPYQIRLLEKAAKDESFQDRLLVYNALGDIFSSGKGAAEKYFDLEKACTYYKAAGELGAVASMTKAGALCFRRANEYPADAADSVQKKNDLFEECVDYLTQAASEGHGSAFLNFRAILEQRPELKPLAEPRLTAVVQEAEGHAEKSLKDHKILGYSAMLGAGAPTDTSKAIPHLRVAADAGDFNAKLYVDAYDEAASKS